MVQRVAVVTGGMGGLGEAICIKLSGMDYKVCATYSPGNTKANDWLADMKKQGHTFYAVQVDVADFESCAKAVKQIEAEVGPIDVLVNNAGITRDRTFVKMGKPDWDAVLRTNLDSVFNMTKAVIDDMVGRTWGRVINISSVNGQKGAFGQANYSAAKAGDLGFVKALAQEGARAGITVNAICPGYIATEMVKAIDPAVIEKSILPHIPVGRLGEPEEIARAVLFLVSDEASFVTGSTISANGGQYLI